MATPTSKNISIAFVPCRIFPNYTKGIDSDFTEKFGELIARFNSGNRNIKELSEELAKLSRNLSEEQHRHVPENMPKEELVILDTLTRHVRELSTTERAKVIKVARYLLVRLKALLVLN